MTVLCVLPARLGSERLPRKPLQMIAGRPLVEWTWMAASRVPGVDEVLVATDSEEIAGVVTAFGGSAVLTSAEHPSGTDRVAEAVAGRGADVIVNFQADEPFLAAASVRAAIDAIVEGRAGIATLATPITSEAEWRSPAVVKVARTADGAALYFSRAPIPHPRDGAPDWAEARDLGPSSQTALAPASPWLRHVGLYAYSGEALAAFVALPPSPLEEIERLEQLRALEAGMRIAVCLVAPGEPGIDVPDDVARAAELLRAAPHDHEHRKRETHA
ncbi:MAG: 3-deoxy-manno-octulosonate cytidylyltransferase [Gemmatimonadota bacterium]